MQFIGRFTLPQDDQLLVPGAWFDAQKQQPVQKNDPGLRRYLESEIDTLQAFHDGRTDVVEAARDITQPISTSSSPDLGGYSDQTLAVTALWSLVIKALMEWPSSHIPNLLNLLTEIKKLPDNIHGGEVAGDSGDTLGWRHLPWFAMAWNDGTNASLQPGQIYRQCSDEHSLIVARRIYLKSKEIEAQLVAQNILGLSKSMVQNIIRALEKDIDENDSHIASSESAGFTQVKLDFQIPAICSHLNYNRDKLYSEVVENGLKDWTPRQIPAEAKQFKDGSERWAFWEQRLSEIAEGEFDINVKNAAKASLDCMK